MKAAAEDAYEIERRANVAREILSHDDFQVAAEEVKDILKKAWEGTSMGQKVDREDLWHQLKAVDSVFRRLRGWIQEEKEYLRKVEQRGG